MPLPQEQADRLTRVTAVISVVGVALCLFGWMQNPAQFFHSWLAAATFWLSVTLGALFFTMLHHLTAARWSTVIRRFFENLGLLLPLQLLLFLPLFGGMGELYHWTHADAVAQDHLLQLKAPYLNVPFFMVRTLVYFAIWSLLAWRLWHLSVRHDQKPEAAHLASLKRISAPGMILFAVTFTFASFDWLMSLDAHWYSTIFGVYTFAGAIVALLATVILILFGLQKYGHLRQEIGPEQFHDLGRLLFAFTVFWAYMAFSQYFLIWYGNIPEETIWFTHRWHGTWKAVTLLLVLGHFLVPFVILMTRWAKRSRLALPLLAGWLLFMHWLDLQWLVMPTLHPHDYHFSWQDVVTLAATGGILAYFFIRMLARRSMVPVAAADLSGADHH